MNVEHFCGQHVAPRHNILLPNSKSGDIGVNVTVESFTLARMCHVHSTGSSSRCFDGHTLEATSHVVTCEVQSLSEIVCEIFMSTERGRPFGGPLFVVTTRMMFAGFRFDCVFCSHRTSVTEVSERTRHVTTTGIVRWGYSKSVQEKSETVLSSSSQAIPSHKSLPHSLPFSTPHLV